MIRPTRSPLARLQKLLATSSVVACVFVMSGWTACQITIEPLDEDQTEPAEPGDDDTDPNEPPGGTEPGEPTDPNEPPGGTEPGEPPRPDDCQVVDFCEVFVDGAGEVYEECFEELLCPEPVDPPPPGDCERVEFCVGYSDANGQTGEECWSEDICPEPIDPNECQVIEICEGFVNGSPDGTTDPSEPNGDVFCHDELVCPEPGDDCFDLSPDECANIEHCILEEWAAPCAAGEPAPDDSAGPNDPTYPQCDPYVEQVCVPAYLPEPLPPQCHELELCVVTDEAGDDHLVDATEAGAANDAGLTTVECWTEVVCDDGNTEPGEPTDPDQPTDDGSTNGGGSDDGTASGEPNQP